jgi:hypothetical protein
MRHVAPELAAQVIRKPAIAAIDMVDEMRGERAESIVQSTGDIGWDMPASERESKGASFFEKKNHNFFIGC